MSVKTYTDTTRIIETIEEHVWEIHCDAIGCNNSLEFRENQDTGDITADGDYTGPDMDTEWLNIHSACHWMRCCTSSPILKRPHPTRMISRPNSSNH